MVWHVGCYIWCSVHSVSRSPKMSVTLNAENALDVHDLPFMCYACLPHTHKVIGIRKWETGYYDLSKGGGYEGNDNYTGEQYARDLNERLGVTVEQQVKMYECSVLGWR